MRSDNKEALALALEASTIEAGRARYQRHKRMVQAMPSEIVIQTDRVITRPDFLRIAGTIGSRLD